MLSRATPRVGRTLRRLAARVASTASTTNSVPTQKPSAEATHPAGPSQPPPAVTSQSPNYPTTWSTGQRLREDAYKEARFEQTNLEFQPQPLSAMELISKEPVRIVHGRKAVCDGGIGPLGHPKVFINLDKPGPKACGYCGIRFQQAPHGHSH